MPDLDRTTLLKLRELDAKATPGPWVYERLAINAKIMLKGETESHDVRREGEPEYLSICGLACTRGKYEREEANGKLIAAMRNALPSLFTALESQINPAPSEAPVEAFTAEEIDAHAQTIIEYGPACLSGQLCTEISDMLTDYARLVRERHTLTAQLAAKEERRAADEANMRLAQEGHREALKRAEAAESALAAKQLLAEPFIGDASALWHKQVTEEADAQAKADESARSTWNICQCGHSRTNHGDGDSPPCLIVECGCQYFVLVVRERHTGKG
jgi:hypothetical protein